MVIQFTGKNLEISDSLKEMVNKKVKKLDRYFEPETEVSIVMSTQRARHIVEITIPFDGVILRGEEATDDMYTSIEHVVQKLEKQIHHHRTRLEKRLRGGAFHGDAPDMGLQSGANNVNVIRTKRFAIKPLDVDEAALQMQLLGHDFFVFMNSDSGEVNVLYRRKDGQLGLIEPMYD
jgi:putative sigma-54 modulation protein